MFETYSAICQQLDEAGVAYQLHEHRPIISARDLDESLPFATDNLLKTVGFRIKDGNLVLAAVQGFDRIDYKALAGVFGLNRRMLRPLGPEDVHHELKMEVGGVCPLPQTDNVEVIIDEKMTAFPTVFCGSGLNTVTLEIGMAPLLSLSAAKVAQISK